MVFLPSFSNFSIANTGGGWDGWQDEAGWEVAKTPPGRPIEQP